MTVGKLSHDPREARYLNKPGFDSVADCLILAGGLGRRMGGPKALLEVNGLSLLERQFQLLSPLFERTFVALKDAALLEKIPTLPWDAIVTDPPGSRCLLDVIGNAIEKVGRPVFLAAVDLPLLSPSVVEQICSRHSDGNSVVPVDEGRPQPLAAVWDPASLEVLEPPDGDLALLAWVRRVNATLLKWPDDFHQHTEEEQSSTDPFRNINTPEDLLGLESED
ncbi:MAG: molybdenum cofactor guanylyltransferase [Planctomycetota bacterium]